jgi:hypothetical protein
MDEKFIVNIIQLLSNPEINYTEYKFHSGNIEPIVNFKGKTIGHTAIFNIHWYTTEIKIGIRQLEIQKEKLVFVIVNVQQTYFSILFNLFEFLNAPHIKTLFISEWNKALRHGEFKTEMVEMFEQI